MKKTLSIILAILMIIAVIPLNAFAAGTSATIPEIGLTADKTKVVEGDIITVTVTLPENSKLCALGYDIIFDASCLSVVENSANLKDVFDEELINPNLSGKIKYAGAAKPYIDDASQVLFTIQFRVLKAPCSIQAEIIEAYEEGENEKEINVTNEYQEYSTKTIDFEGTHTHSYKAVITAPTCTEAGYTTYMCSECNLTYTGNETSATGHTEETIPAVAPTCTTTGFTEGVKCSVCGEILTAQQEIPATGHADNDGDGYCDADDELLDPTVECNCNCHKSGISNFFFKFALFFQKLFGANKTCDCGIAHY